jgi:hypothetical protein
MSRATTSAYPIHAAVARPADKCRDAEWRRAP